MIQRRMIMIACVCIAAIAMFSLCGTQPRVCTTMGCVPGVQVKIIDPEWKAAPVVDVLIIADGREIRDRDCEHTPGVEEEHEHTVSFSGGACSVRIEDRGQPVKNMRVTVRWDGGEVTRDFQPEYVMHYPNGPDCPGACKQAVVEMRL